MNLFRIMKMFKEIIHPPPKGEKAINDVINKYLQYIFTDRRSLYVKQQIILNLAVLNYINRKTA